MMIYIKENILLFVVIDTALILAGGQGLRLRPLTLSIPKPLLPIKNKTIIEKIIDKLKANNIKIIYISLNYKSDMIKSLLGDGSKHKIKIIYLEEKIKLGTVGSIRLIKKPPKNLFVINGDILSNINLKELFKSHLESGNCLTIAIKNIRIKNDYGVLTLNKNEVIDYTEKPISSFKVSTGMYVLSRLTIKHIPKNISYGINKLTKDLIKKSIPINSYLHKGYWKDIGSFENYKIASEE